MQLYTVYFICKLFCLFRVVPAPILRSANNCNYSNWYLSRRYCCLPLSWKSRNRFECAVGGSGGNCTHPQERKQLYLQQLVFVTPLLLSAGSDSSTKAADSNNYVTNTSCCRYSVCAPKDGCRYHPKQTEQFPDKINCVKLHFVGYILE
jgi:hypothetical protein